MRSLGMTEGVPITAKIISKSIENAQKHVESRNFDIRKHLLEFDDVMNRQREVIYLRRKNILYGKDLYQNVLDFMDEESQSFVMQWLDNPPESGPNYKELEIDCAYRFGFFPDIEKLTKLEGDARFDYFYENGVNALKEHLSVISPEYISEVLRYVLLLVVDIQWKNHLFNMDHLKDGIGLRGYAQKDPLREYQREGFEYFQELLDRIRTESLAALFRQKFEKNEEPPKFQRKKETLNFSGGGDNSSSKNQTTYQKSSPKIGRNDPCPCGSGKKYKFCCGA
jgi:preprotein translocase subunit SecA